MAGGRAKSGKLNPLPGRRPAPGDSMRILQLSDPHLLADPAGLCRGRPPAAMLRRALRCALEQADAAGGPPDLLLISGDLCHDESWGGYVRLRELLEAEPLAADLPLALLAGNHEQPALLRAVWRRRAQLAPALLRLGGWRLLLLDSHWAGRVAGRLGERQLRWIAGILRDGEAPLLVALHHPPVAIGDPLFDAIGLADGPELLSLLGDAAAVRGVLFGHVHQHWQGSLPGRPELPLLACPSTLSAFAAVQRCPLGRPDDPGGRLLDLGDDGSLRQRLLRWCA